MLMKNYLEILTEKLKAMLGPVWSFIPMMAAAVTSALKAGDAEKLRAHAQELREFGQACIAAADELDTIAADDKVSLAELGKGLETVQTLIDEGEDVVTGKDEDDLPSV